MNLDLNSNNKLSEGPVGKLSKPLLKLHELAIAYPKSSLSLFFVFLALCLPALLNLKMLLSIDDLIDPDFKTYHQLKSLNDRFLNQDEIFVVIKNQDSQPLSKPQLCSISDWIQKDVAFRGDIKAVLSTLGIQWPTESETGFKIKAIIEPDCTDLKLDETPQIQASIEKILGSPWNNTLIGHDGKDIGILIYPHARVGGDFFGTFNSKIVEELRESFREKIQTAHPKLRAAWIGDGIFQYYLKRGYETMPALNGLLSLFILLLFFYFFKTWMSGLILLQLVTWISLPIYAGMALFDHPIDVLTSALSLMIFVAALEDFIFITKLSQNKNWKTAYKTLLVPSFFTSLTTFIGFGSLYFADLDIIRRFGIWAAAASLLEWIVMFLVFPAILVQFPKLQGWMGTPRDFKWVNSLLNLKPHKVLSWGALVIFPLAILSTQSLYVSDSPEKLLREDHPTRQDLRFIESTRGWRAQYSLVFKDHEKRDFNLSIIDEVKAWPLVNLVESIYDTHDFLTGHLSNEMQSYFKSLINESTIGHRLGPEENVSRAMIYVKSLDIVDINKMRSQIQRLCPNQECWLSGTLVSHGELGERVLTTLYKSFGISLGLVALLIVLLCILMGQQNHIFALLTSAMWGPAALLCLYFIFNIPVFYITSMVASILVGLAGDNAIQFLFFGHSQDTSIGNSISKLAPASIFSAIAMAIAASVFFFGYFDPMKSLGIMMVAGFLLSVLGDIWLLKGLKTQP